MRRRLFLTLLSFFMIAILTAGCHFVAFATEYGETTATFPEMIASRDKEPTETTGQHEDLTSETSVIESSSPETAGTESSTSETTTEETTAATTKATTRRTTQATTAATINMDSPYYLYAEKGSFTLVVYGKDEAGEFTKVIRTIRMAIGRGTMTPKGRFKIGTKYTWKNSGGVYLPYACTFKTGLMIHGPIYTEQDRTTMKDWSYNEIGTKATSGCLRIPIADVKWIFDNCPKGTTLDIVDGSPRGFSPPALIPIVISGRDPTDPDLAPAPTTAPVEPTEPPAPTPEPSPSPTPEAT